MRDVYLIIRFTRHWIHYGFMAHVTFFCTIAAIKGLLAR